MKYVWVVLPLFFVGCSSIKYVTVIHGQIYSQRHEPVNIVGNPPLICTDIQTQRKFSGYFIRQDDDGTVLLDNFGKGTFFLRGDLTCELKLDASVAE